MKDMNKKIGNILKKRRKEIGYSLEDIKILLKKNFNIDLDNSNISRYENGTVKNMNAAFLRALCKIIQIDYVPIFQELGYLGNKNELSLQFSSNAQMIDDVLISVPVMAIASAGTGQINFEDSPLKTITIPRNGYNADTYLIEVSGDSMEPVIKDGSYIVINPNDIEIQNEKIYVINYDGHIFIKKIIINKDIKAIILKSVNPKYEDKYITENMLDSFKVIGRAIEIIYKSKL